jgi:hypothetical protein
MKRQDFVKILFQSQNRNRNKSYGSTSLDFGSFKNHAPAAVIATSYQQIGKKVK